MKKKILLLEGDYTQALPTVKSLSKRGYEVDGVFSSKLSYGYGSRYFRKKYLFKETQNFEKFRIFVLELLKNEPYDAIIPLNDESAILLSRCKNLFAKYSNFEIPDWQKFEKGYDKHLLMNECCVGGFPHPKTISIIGPNIPQNEALTLNFPVLIKPNYSSGARGITYAETLFDLYERFPKIVAEYGDCHIQEFIPAGGAQIKVQLYINDKGELVQSSVIHKFRWYPNEGGSSCCNMSTENDRIVEILHKLLQQIKWVGFADFDTIQDPRSGELLIIELNPRMPACVKTAFSSGIDWADVIVSEYLNLKHRKYTSHKKIILRHLGFEVLWFLYSRNRWSTVPNWFRFIGKGISYQDMNGFSDIKPFFFGTYGNLRKQMSKKFRDSKSLKK